jgi:hypothetical protein
MRIRQATQSYTIPTTATTYAGSMESLIMFFTIAP